MNNIDKFYDLGFSIIPTGRDKKPLIQWKDYQEKKATKDELNKWFSNGSNPAVICGKISENLIVLDCDDPHITERLQIETFTVRTPSGGIHLYVKSKVIPDKQQAYRGYALDIQGDKAYALLPGAKTDKGEYVILKDLPIKEFDNILEYLDTKLNPISEGRNGDIQNFKKKVGSAIFSKWLNFEVEGHNYKQAKCPFHGDNDPSLTVYDSGYHCFGCGEHGDIIDFVMKIDSIDFKTAIKKISEMSGVIAPDIKEQNKTNEYEQEPLKEPTEDNQERRINLRLPESHFISQYVKWGESVTDAYKEYHILNAMWLLSAATNRKIVLKLRQEHIRPNLWIMVLGNSTTSRKSTAVNKARKIFECATDKNLPNDDFSLEGYLESLSSEPIMHNVKDEASGLLSKYHQRYNDGIFDFECSVYDGSPETLQKRLASGKAKEPKKYTIKNYYVTKLYATTPDKLAHCMSINDFMCGYGYRWIFNYPKYKHDRKPLEMETPEDVSSWLKVIGRIRDFNNLFIKSDEIEFKATSEVMQYYDDICIEMENRAEEQNNDILNSIIGRSQIHILKIAMLLELGKYPVSTTLTEESVKTAAEMITGYCIPSIMEVIERLQEDVKNNYIEKIISILRRLGGEATHTKLLRDSNMKSRDFIECIETMKESHRIKIVQEKPAKYKLINHENVLDFRGVRKVRNVRTYIEDDNNSTNITKIVSVDTYTPSTTLLRTNELNELNEQNEISQNPGKELTQNEHISLIRSKILELKNTFNAGVPGHVLFKSLEDSGADMPRVRDTISRLVPTGHISLSGDKKGNQLYHWSGA